MQETCAATRGPGGACDCLEERELAVLRELGRDSEADVAFQGLRRRLELHQESLARMLRRLEECGLVSHGEKGYRLTESGFGALSGKRIETPKRESLTILQGLLPPHVEPSAVSEELARRWFRGLRWYGQRQTPDEVVLTWLTEPGGAAVKVRVAGSVFTLEVESPPGESDRGFRASRGVLAALAELYGLRGGSHGAGAAFAVGGAFAA